MMQTVRCQLSVLPQHQVLQTQLCAKYASGLITQRGTQFTPKFFAELGSFSVSEHRAFSRYELIVEHQASPLAHHQVEAQAQLPVLTHLTCLCEGLGASVGAFLFNWLHSSMI